MRTDWAAPLGVGVRTLVRTATEILLPALCVACDGVLAGNDRGLCGACRSRLHPMSEPCCPRCGVPADSETDPCLACVSSPPPQQGTVLWGAYDGVLRRAVLALKHRGHDEVARPLGRRLAARIGLAPWFDEITVLTTVPSNGLRRLRRGTSAAGLLGAEVARAIDRPLIRTLRRHGRGRQAGRTRATRLQLPRGCFSARRGMTGHRVLLVDDVCTTGTTLRRAADTLLGAGAETVFCATIAHAIDSRRM
jgi:ComF family protein